MVEIWALWRPWQEANLLPLKYCPPYCMTWCSILLKYKVWSTQFSPILFEGVTDQSDVSSYIHTTMNNPQTPCTISCHALPHLDFFSSMLHCRNNTFWMVFLSFSPSHKDPPPRDQFKSRLIWEEYTSPLFFCPTFPLLGPCKSLPLVHRGFLAATQPLKPDFNNLLLTVLVDISTSVASSKSRFIILDVAFLFNREVCKKVILSWCCGGSVSRPWPIPYCACLLNFLLEPHTDEVEGHILFLNHKGLVKWRL